MKTVDYIIVGQGIAGTSLAHRLEDAGLSYIIIDEKRPHQASRVASGMWNPLVFKRFTKVWLADEMLAAFSAFYAEVEKRFSISIQKQQNVLRLFANPKEIDEWLATSDNPAFHGMLDENIIREIPNGLHPKAGMGRVLKSGRIDTGTWLDAARNHFSTNHVLREEPFAFDALKLTPTGVAYQDIAAKGIVFCEGMYAASQNPYFSFLPFKLTKGEVISILCPSLALHSALSAGVSIIPLGDDMYKIAATYDWDNLNFEATQEAKESLMESARKIIALPFTVVDHEVGIRPTVKDRRALLGIHPEHPQLFIFNGLGTRGVLMAPYLSASFVAFLQTGEGIHPEANIARFR